MTYEVGQEVAINEGYGSGAYSRGRIARITPTGKIVLESGQKFSRTGSEEGQWSRRSIEPMTPEIEAKMRQRKLALRLGYLDWSKLPLATLEAVAVALEAASSGVGG